MFYKQKNTERTLSSIVFKIFIDTILFPLTVTIVTNVVITIVYFLSLIILLLLSFITLMSYIDFFYTII